MKVLQWLLKLVLRLLAFCLGLILLLVLFQYLCAPVYHFPKKQVFYGNKFYNPYQDCDSAWWKKSVFHKHTESWGGVNYVVNTTQSTFDRYKYLGYDIVALSDYQYINRAKFPNQDEHIPNYEHGFGMKKNHHLSIGAQSILPFDFIFPQTASNKQFIINLLRKRTEVLALAHPDWYGAVTSEDVKQLCNYDCFEIFSNYHNSLNIWDSALSAGMPAFLIADDDNDEIENPNVVGRCMTLVNAKKTTLAQVSDALKKGKTIGVRVFSKEDEKWEAKKKNIYAIPVLNSAEVKGDTLNISVSEMADTIVFIGQNGVVMKTALNCKEAFFLLKSNDTYIRTYIVFRNGTRFYLNPVLRYNGTSFSFNQAGINISITILKNLLFIGILIFGIYLYRQSKKSRRRRS